MKPMAPVRQEGGLPAPFFGHPGHQENGGHGADIGAGVEDPGGDAALAFGEPFGDGLDAGGKIGRLAEAQKYAGDSEGKAVVAAACIMAAALHTATAMAKAMRVPNLSRRRPAPSRPMAYAAAKAEVMLPY